ncbi:glutathione S-transferase family protein [Vibrio sp. VPAP30]|uniref:glutathione S-transferase family protein n=1 Tax=Vibrio sp. VPAP30 TaxID=1647102 RepID=UPI0006579BEB|nr:glutathione S-transferase family protein [Vibrio sp. VPAP30]KLN66240.1 glutathione S-transferase [Vibrio sp. VPAP30]
MYTLYFLPEACSLATQTVLRELQQEVALINVQSLESFSQINPVANVPVLVDGDQTLTEGAAIMLYLLEKHPSKLWPNDDPVAKQVATQNIMFANATMHPAYSKLFFAASSISEEELRQQIFDAATSSINKLWQVVEQKLEDAPFLGGIQISPADIMLAVYSRWGAAFPVDIIIPAKSQQMIDRVLARPSFTTSLNAEYQNVSPIAAK